MIAFVENINVPDVIIVGMYEQATADAMIDLVPGHAHPGDAAGPGARDRVLVLPGDGVPCGAWTLRDVPSRRTRMPRPSGSRGPRRSNELESQIVKQLVTLRDSGPTEELNTGSWDLAAALLRAGQTFKALPTGGRVILLLGGLAVRRPPGDHSTRLLGGVQIVSAGWSGTTAEQDAWVARLHRAGTTISFVPTQVTDLLLTGRISEALASLARPAH